MAGSLASQGITAGSGANSGSGAVRRARRGGAAVCLALLFALFSVFPPLASRQAQAQAETGAEMGVTAQGEALRTVRVQLKWRHQFQFAGFYAAIEQGFYRDAGLAVELIEYSPGITPIDQLIGGRVDFAVADTGALIYRATGVPLVALAAIFQHSPSILLARGDRGIEDLADLRGRRVMLSGGYMNAELMAMLATAGLGPADFEMLPADTSVQILVDDGVEAYNAYTTNEPYLLERQGVPYRLFQPRDHGVDFYGDLLITTARLIAEEPDLVASFRAATLAGWAHAAEHPEATVEAILAGYNSQGKTRDHLLFEAEESIRLILSNVVPIGYMHEERWRRIESAFLEQGLVRGRSDLAAFLYEPEPAPGLLRLLARHRIELAVGGGLLFVLLLLAHIAHLRARIAFHTRELREAKRRAEEEARNDALTGMPNRRHFLEVASHDIAQAERLGLPLALLVVDIDFFKAVNDRHGHLAGDEVLRRVARILKQGVRTGDLAARFGGEEFAVACPGCTTEEALALAERLRAAVEAAPLRFQQAALRLTVSIGLAVRRPGESLDRLLQNADSALYEAKQRGRNRVCLYGCPEPATGE